MYEKWLLIRQCKKKKSSSLSKQVKTGPIWYVCKVTRPIFSASQISTIIWSVKSAIASPIEVCVTGINSINLVQQISNYKLYCTAKIFVFSNNFSQYTSTSLRHRLVRLFIRRYKVSFLKETNENIILTIPALIFNTTHRSSLGVSNSRRSKGTIQAQAISGLL